VNSLCLLPDARLASGSSDDTIRLWDVTTGAETERLEIPPVETYRLWLLPDGHFATCTCEETAAHPDFFPINAPKPMPVAQFRDGPLGWGRWAILLYDIRSGLQTARLEWHSDEVSALCLLPDGRLASASHDKTIRLWDVTTGAETARFEGHSDKVNSLCLLRDGRLASGSSDDTIRLWDVTTGAETARFEGHSGTVAALCLLSDWRLASGSHDNTIRLWDLRRRAEIARLEVDAPVTALVAMAPNRLVARDSVARLHWLEVLY
jgi:WD40 repeat protein